MGVALLLFFACGLAPLGLDSLVALENKYARPAAMPEQVDGIVVLGGAFDTYISAKRGAATVNDGGERVFEAIALAKRYPMAVPVFSGGEGLLFEDTGPESDDMAAWMEAAGVDPARFIFEDESRNTRENLLFTKNLVLPQEGETWLLVTSAYHMPRAMMVARGAGWELVPWPVDYRTDGKIRLWPQKFDVAGNFYKTDLALHELVGMAAYRLLRK
ncbi:MAG: YdcF family protein [Proteobacteria bacterium]|nr:YdcF family protein [Pseudomonadota bacterium]